MENRKYVCIDLKSFYASVECVERGLDPMKARLVVADPERSDKTVCLAVSPALKALGVKNRCRVFQIPPNIEYIMAVPRMKLYIDYSAEIYGVYLKYIAPEDIHVYSIDEVFLDVTDYLKLYDTTAKGLGIKIMEDIFKTTGITSSCGVGTNLYLAKIAMDITAKHSEDHIGVLDEKTYCETMWNHRPITDFWRVGKGIANRLALCGINTMGQLAHADEDWIYRKMGIDAELLIDHAWGRETATIADIKAYKPKHNCISSGQVLMRDYDYRECRLIVEEMVDLQCLELVSKNLVTASITLHIGYSNRENVEPAHGTAKLPFATSTSKIIMPKVADLYDKIINPYIPIRRVYVTCNNVVTEGMRQANLFEDFQQEDKEERVQKVMVEIKRKFGKNAVFKGMNLQEGATTIERNRQIGGHKSGE